MTDQKKIAKTYLKGWFGIDFVATFPWDVLSSEVKILKLLRLLRLTRLLKKLDKLKGANAFRFVKLIFGFFLLAHWVACVWWAFGVMEANMDLEGNDNHSSWLLRLPPVGTAEDGFSLDAFRACVDACVAEGRRSRTECMGQPCDSNNLSSNSTITDFSQQYLSSFYWAMTMLMKSPFVGPDTVYEKFFGCTMVVVGAVVFALLLGNVHGTINAVDRSGAQLRDTLTQMSVFCTTRQVPRKLRTQLFRQFTAEWALTGGMDTQAVLREFPATLRYEVLHAIYAPLLAASPSMFRACPEQLRRHMLTLVRPTVALKKEVVCVGGQYTATIYILMKGTLQVSQAQGLDMDNGSRGNSPSVTPTKKRGKGGGSSWKDRMRFRMLEKPGATIPPADIHQGPRPSPFAIFATNQCQLYLIDGHALSRLLDQYFDEEAEKVLEALYKEHQSLVDALKMNKKDDRATAGNDRASGVESDSAEKRRSSARISMSPGMSPGGGSGGANGGGRNGGGGGGGAPTHEELELKVAKLSEESSRMVLQVESLKHQTKALPRLLWLLQARLLHQQQVIAALPPSVAAADDVSLEPNTPGGEEGGGATADGTPAVSFATANGDGSAANLPNRRTSGASSAAGRRSKASCSSEA